MMSPQSLSVLPTCCVFGLFLLLLFAAAPRLQAAPGIAYHLSWDKPQSHYVHVQMDLTNLAGETLDVRIPAWRPGRYILQNYAKDVIGFWAEDGQGNALTYRKTDKGTWRIQTGGAAHVVVRYQSYARQLDAGASYLDETEAYINPITLLMYIPGQELQPVKLTLAKPADWNVATALEWDAAQAAYTAENYHELVDSPLLISPDFKTYTFEEGGAQFELVFQGEANYDPEKVVADVQKIARAQIEIMQVVPFTRYVFLYHLMPHRIGHGVEHKNSTSIVIGPADFENRRWYGSFLNVTAHELFHVWNVERIRPEAIYLPDYSVEQYTTTMWIYEGITSYYTGVSLVRAGLMPEQLYLNQVASGLQSYDAAYGRKVRSVAMSSWDSWTTSSDAPPHTTYSFYTGGDVMGLLLDLEVRARTENKNSLDDVFRYLYATYAAQDRGVPETGLEQALEAVTGSSFQSFFDAYVYGTEPIDYNAFLQHAGLRLEKIIDPSKPAVYLGADFEGKKDAPVLQRVEPETPAFEAGLMIDDELVALDGKRIEKDTLNKLLKVYQPGDTATLMFFRRGMLRTADVTFTGGRNLKYVIKPVEEPSKMQTRIKADWLKPMVES